MNIFRKIKNVVMTVAATALISTALVSTPSTAYAHEAKCPYCKLDVVQDTKDQDNEVVLRYGNKRIEYRCVMCAVAHAKTKYKNDLTILAPSNVKGKPVKISRTGGEWKAEPETAVFVFQKGNHSKCQDLYRAVADHAQFEKYVKAKGLEKAEHLTLKQLVEKSK